MPDPFTPSALPPIVSVDVVILSGEIRRQVGQKKFDAFVTLRGEPANHIADLWRQLPPGDPARCHIPPFALRFSTATELICDASICWECNNILGDAHGQHLFYAFDANSAPAQELLALLQKAVMGAESTNGSECGD